MNKYFLLSIIGIIALVLAFMFVANHKIGKHHVDDTLMQTIMEWRSPIGVDKIQVVNGNEYDLSLKDGRRIKASLGIATTPEAREKVVNFLNRTSNPRVILKKQDGGNWLVSLYVTARNSANQEVEIDLSTWLREKNLVYNW